MRTRLSCFLPLLAGLLLAGAVRAEPDLRDTRLARGARMPAGIGAVDTIRTGPRPNATLRVVIELKSAAASRGQWQPAFADVADQYLVAIGTKAFVTATFSPRKEPGQASPFRACLGTR